MNIADCDTNPRNVHAADPTRARPIAANRSEPSALRASVAMSARPVAGGLDDGRPGVLEPLRRVLDVAGEGEGGAGCDSLLGARADAPVPKRPAVDRRAPPGLAVDGEPEVREPDPPGVATPPLHHRPIDMVVRHHQVVDTDAGLAV